jgi:hypothetical protein
MNEDILQSNTEEGSLNKRYDLGEKASMLGVFAQGFKKAANQKLPDCELGRHLSPLKISLIKAITQTLNGTQELSRSLHQQLILSKLALNY